MTPETHTVAVGAGRFAVVILVLLTVAMIGIYGPTLAVWFRWRKAGRPEREVE